MSYWHFIAINRIVVVKTSIIVSNPMADKLVSKEVIVLPLVTASSFFKAQKTSVKVLSSRQVVHWYGQMERLAWSILAYAGKIP